MKRRLQILKTTYTHQQAARFAGFGDITTNGVPFDTGLAGADGAWFTLLQLPGVDVDDLMIAAEEIHHQRDVVGTIGIARVEG